MPKKENLLRSYELAKERYAELGVDTEAVLKILKNISISLHCWQGDDVGGFEKTASELSGGIMVTGNYPGKARNVEELRKDLEKTYSLIPGTHRLNLHAMYGEFGGKKIDRNEIAAQHFQGWINWAKSKQLKLDFNPTCFSHPKAESGYTLSSKDTKIRKFWIEHVKRTRKISEFIGKNLGGFCINNIWIPDGSKDIPSDRGTPRTLLKESLDEIFADKYDRKYLKDSVESKLFGIGSESYVVGSHEFYMGYAMDRGMMLCLDTGHFHPTESIADKISAIMQFSDELLMHISRGIRWDSDHVAILNDEVQAIANEIVQGNYLNRIHIALDYFDASMNRVGAWVIGARATLKAMLSALLRPQKQLVEYEDARDYFGRLALMEELKTMPFSAVWDVHCMKAGVPVGTELIDEVNSYEKKVQSKR
jgi:L-rhamnose isomerase